VDRDAAAVALRAELGVSRTVGLIGFVGHLIAQKRPDRALDALAAMHRLGEQAHLVVAGDGPLRNQFELDVVDRGLVGFVHVLGHRNDIPQILAAIDVVILTSDSEGLPGVLIEAQMAGCPVVTVPVGGVRDLVDDGETGFVVDDLDPEMLARRVVDLLRDPQLRKRMGERGRRRAVRFSSARAAGTYAARLAEVVGPVKIRP
jgi:glycosyltransferase involved in cell wall biosynthesis